MIDKFSILETEPLMQEILTFSRVHRERASNSVALPVFAMGADFAST